MSAVEEVARRWHEGSDHARDGSPFGGHLCNCMRIARRVTPMLHEAWGAGYKGGAADMGSLLDKDLHFQNLTTNPYRLAASGRAEGELRAEP